MLLLVDVLSYQLPIPHGQRWGIWIGLSGPSRKHRPIALDSEVLQLLKSPKPGPSCGASEALPPGMRWPVRIR